MPGFGFPAGELTPALLPKVTAPLGPKSAAGGGQSDVAPSDVGRVYNLRSLFSRVVRSSCF